MKFERAAPIEKGLFNRNNGRLLELDLYALLELGRDHDQGYRWAISLSDFLLPCRVGRLPLLLMTDFAVVI